jgi:crossover junction endodeoxyribonuclease RusA
VQGRGAVQFLRCAQQQEEGVSEITIKLPWPPSINSMYQQGIIGGVHKKARASMFLSKVGKEYRLQAQIAIAEQRVPRGALHGRLMVSAIAYPPDARIRDLDNLWKSALDVLKHNQVIADDGHIDDLHVRRAHQVKDGSFAITISEIAGAFESRQQGLELFEASSAVS